MKEHIRNLLHKIDVHFLHILIGLLAVIPILIGMYYFSPLSKKAPVRYDGVGYYAYLPGLFHEHDLSFSFLIDEDAEYSFGENTFERRYNEEEVDTVGFHKQENGRFFDKYPLGVAILLVPFFLIGHAITMITGEAANGWSFFYQYSVFYGGLVYASSGIYFLKKVLRKYFSIPITLATVCIILFGTSFFNYATYENIFSHVYSFFLITLLLYITPKLIKQMTYRSALLVGGIVGLMVLVRQTNVVFILIILLYGVSSMEDGIKRVRFFWKKKQHIIISAITAFLIFFPQVAYWKYASGSWITSSYGDEGFNFLKPQIFNVLFSVQKGLFFWSPLLLLGVIGWFRYRKKLKNYQTLSITLFVLQTYLISSWWNWEFGWSYGHRAYVDMYAIFALGIAQSFATLRGYWIKITMYLLSVLLIFLSMFQMGQYWLRIIPPSSATWEDYKKVFLNVDLDLRYYWRDRFSPKDDEV